MHDYDPIEVVRFQGMSLGVKPPFLTNALLLFVSWYRNVLPLP